jgi:glycosyltransferase involved in cell wall biosynthesis
VLRAFTKALPSLPNAKLIFIGKTDVEPDYFEDMELFVIREGIQDEVTFTGCIERTETLAWLKEADVHIIPARFMNVGTIVLESWASDTVVLQSDAVDPNLVIEDFNGFLFRSEDIEDLALQMQKAYSNRKRLPELAERGKALVHDNYSFDKLMIRFQKVYKQVIH